MAVSLSPSELEAWLRFSHLGLPAAKLSSLLKAFGGPAGVLGATEAQLLAVPGVTPQNYDRIRECAGKSIARDRSALESLGAHLALPADAEYPGLLRTISDPPPLLFVRGALTEAEACAVAVVGTRNPSSYGRAVAERLASDLARRGLTVVSGLARGIDTAAHRGALSVKGRTVAVCGCGVDVVYPRENRELTEQIVHSGAVISEFALGIQPEPWHFPARNRVISGMALGTMVVEAPENSGALITADFALEQGREVFAVPGNIDNPRSRGTHRLLKEGAKLVETVEDILEELNITVPERPVLAPPVPKLSSLEERVYKVLALQQRHVDEIIRLAQVSPAEANSALMLLEIKGVARRLAGGMFQRTA